jgi:redox-sensitive bicupin YhaK (pirin superfamily)
MTTDVASEKCTALGNEAGSLEAYPNRSTTLGHLEISRALPIRGKRLVGSWCFLDRFGPLTFAKGKPMDVAPHPHIGLQTVTWLVAGETVHKDSLGSESLLVPGGLNVMTSGAGISHAEETPADNTGYLHGVQLWVALPEAERNRAAAFQHIAEVPAIEVPGGITRVFSGVDSPAHHFSELIGAELQVHGGHRMVISLQTHFEHALLLLAGAAALNAQPLQPQVLYYLSPGRTELPLESRDGARMLLIGGPPFPETILMWWNFVARSNNEIAQARRDWETGERFGEVHAYNGPRLSAPPLMRLAPPNPAS